MQKTIEILLAEDNEGDIELTREAFSQLKTAVNINVCMDGEEALSFLHKTGDFESCKTPDMVLLDISLPKKTGLEVLQEMKSSNKFNGIPVVILSNSQDPDNIKAAYQEYASSYIFKGVELKEFFCIVQSFENFWFNTASLCGKK